MLKNAYNDWSENCKIIGQFQSKELFYESISKNVSQRTRIINCHLEVKSSLIRSKVSILVSGQKQVSGSVSCQM